MTTHMPTGGTSWAGVVLLAVGTFVVGTSELVIAGVLPVVADDLGVSVAAAGYLVTAYALSFAIATPPVAARSGGLSRRLIMLGALGVFGAATALSALAPS